MTVITQEQLAGRTAQCQCGKTQPSDFSLAFFEYRGEGSRVARERCGICAYAPIAHERALLPGNGHLKHIVGHEFTPAGGQDLDLFYCGCRGWD